ncbi:SAM hydrolase/SAM-dependent halogenase family protein [Algoriphagus pacificus]|uniref:SAM-dependent chlorinase/fluorinase n=1 Tax=Algoriphagus pacificus TaxID=2811234 RepID=A0ABS3CM84_9BACT|nr:SAM-dependent chlorinase/fluorinase [Algoriphagus pacificus]MBN7817845.1 SAM-dependent chlorinase/fluorinase [Algoriphagus pacificus]
MALVTFLSDFGDKDYYVPAVKAKMLAVNPQLNIIDISHSIDTFDIAHAAFILRSTFREFPKGTVHLVAINTTGALTQGYIGIKLEEHIFLGPNNGILSLLADHDPGIMVQFADIHLKDTTFPAKDILAPIAAKVASGAAIHDFGGPLTNFRKLMSRQAKATREQILGHVVRVDRYGNLITNIRRDVFEKLNPGKFTIEFGREMVDKLDLGYDQVEPGDCFAFFNSMDLMEIGINHGHGANLLGLKYDSVVFVNFNP